MATALKCPARILVVDDDQDILVAARLLLKRQFASVEVLREPTRVPALLQRDAYSRSSVAASLSVGRSELRWSNKKRGVPV